MGMMIVWLGLLTILITEHLMLRADAEPEDAIHFLNDMTNAVMVMTCYCWPMLRTEFASQWLRNFVFMTPLS
jgi:hypothetical protein